MLCKCFRVFSRFFNCGRGIIYLCFQVTESISKIICCFACEQELRAKCFEFRNILLNLSVLSACLTDFGSPPRIEILFCLKKQRIYFIKLGAILCLSLCCSSGSILFCLFCLLCSSGILLASNTLLIKLCNLILDSNCFILKRCHLLLRRNAICTSDFFDFLLESSISLSKCIKLCGIGNGVFATRQHTLISSRQRTHGFFQHAHLCVEAIYLILTTSSGICDIINLRCNRAGTSRIDKPGD